MARYTKESLEELKSRVDLVDVIGSHIDLKRMGTAYKALCPFHDEKSPSFVVEKGESHYHCYGCSAHGDAIAFLMEHLGYSFTDAIEHLAERSGIVMEQEKSDSASKTGLSFSSMKESLAQVSEFYHFILLRTEAGKKARAYLQARGLGAEFIRFFQIGFSPDLPGLFSKAMQKMGMSEKNLKELGVISNAGSMNRDLFYGRIVFPVCDAMGRVVGFSARKIEESQMGGKYINTPKTPLFTKSKLLFGLNYSRKKMVKTKKALIVEGQIDALTLIHAGFDYTVATLGTAFGEQHIDELVKLGVKEVILAMDGDEAGKKAALKSGDLLQSRGLVTLVCKLEEAEDPDTLIRLKGKEAFEKKIEEAEDFLSFAMDAYGVFAKEPAQKVQAANSLAALIRAWKDPILVHETLKALAEKAHLPLHLLQEVGPKRLQVIKSASNPESPGVSAVDEDIVYWLIHSSMRPAFFFEMAELNIEKESFQDVHCQRLFELCVKLFKEKGSLDLITLCSEADDELSLLIDKLSKKRVNRDKAKVLYERALLKFKERAWLKEREAIKLKIQSGACSDEEVLELVCAFDKIKNSLPKLVFPELSSL